MSLCGSQRPVFVTLILTLWPIDYFQESVNAFWGSGKEVQTRRISELSIHKIGGNMAPRAPRGSDTRRVWSPANLRFLGLVILEHHLTDKRFSIFCKIKWLLERKKKTHGLVKILNYLQQLKHLTGEVSQGEKELC